MSSEYSFDQEINDCLKNVTSQDRSMDFSPPQEEDHSASTTNDVELENGKLDLLLKKKFAHHALWITYGWLGLTMLLLFATGGFRASGASFLSDSVLIALISGTSLSVITGLVTTILRYLLSKR